MLTAESAIIPRVGIALWLLSGVAAFFIARIIPLQRPRRWWPELMVGILVALLFGIVATALDFGGWNELDWRAGAFCAFGSLAVVGIMRVITQRSS